MYDGPRWPIRGRFARNPVCFPQRLDPLVVLELRDVWVLVLEFLPKLVHVGARGQVEFQVLCEGLRLLQVTPIERRERLVDLVELPEHLLILFAPFQQQLANAALERLPAQLEH